jgi:hypothetical protein
MPISMPCTLPALHFALHAAERALRLICFFRLDILQFVTEITEHRLYTAIGIDNPTTHGRLCTKGMNAHQHAVHSSRITRCRTGIASHMFFPIGHLAVCHGNNGASVQSKSFTTTKRFTNGLTDSASSISEKCCLKKICGHSF